MQGNFSKARLVNTARALQRPHAAKPKLNYTARANLIASQRESRLSEIESLRCSGVAPKSFVDKAQTLLTHRWSKATWRSRERLLRTVDWLLRMERMSRHTLVPPI